MKKKTGRSARPDSAARVRLAIVELSDDVVLFGIELVRMTEARALSAMVVQAVEVCSAADTLTPDMGIDAPLPDNVTSAALARSMAYQFHLPEPVIDRAKQLGRQLGLSPSRAIAFACVWCWPRLYRLNCLAQ